MKKLLQTIKTIIMKLASKTGQVNYKQNGEPGQKGDRGPALRGPMEWDGQPEGFPFQSGAEGEDFLSVARELRSHVHGNV